MPARVPDFWEQRLKLHKANNPGWGAGRLWNALKDDAGTFGRDDAPSERWVGNWLRGAWLEMKDEDVRPYRRFSWPASMDRGDLPWEASQAALEFLRESLEIMDMAWAGPSVRVMDIFWHVTQAAPDAPFPDRLWVTSLLLVAKSMGNEEWAGAIQWYLALRPWPSKEANNAYKRAIADQGVPAMPLGQMSYDGTVLEAEDLEFLTLVNIAHSQQDDLEASNAQQT